MDTRHTVAATAVILVLLVAGSFAAALPAAAFSYGISITDTNASGVGSIVFPTDFGSDPTVVDLTLTTLLFGNTVVFSEDDLLGIDWTGADPGDGNLLVVNFLFLQVFANGSLFVLTDNGGAAGEANCGAVVNPLGCGGTDADTTPVTWTYTAQPTAVVPEPSTALLLSAGLGIVAVRRAMGRARRS